MTFHLATYKAMCMFMCVCVCLHMTAKYIIMTILYWYLYVFVALHCSLLYILIILHTLVDVSYCKVLFGAFMFYHLLFT